MVKGKYSTTLGIVEMESCICNASGPRCTQFDELRKIDQSCIWFSPKVPL